MNERSGIEWLPSGLAVADLDDGAARAVRLGRRDVMLCNHKGRFFALDNRCSHADEPLVCGVIRNGWIACPAHGARFELESGKALNPPAVDPVTIYQLRVVNGLIEIALPQG